MDTVQIMQETANVSTGSFLRSHYYILYIYSSIPVSSSVLLERGNYSSSISATITCIDLFEIGGKYRSVTEQETSCFCSCILFCGSEGRCCLWWNSHIRRQQFPLGILPRLEFLFNIHFFRVLRFFTYVCIILKPLGLRKSIGFCVTLNIGRKWMGRSRKEDISRCHISYI